MKLLGSSGICRAYQSVYNSNHIYYIKLLNAYKFYYFSGSGIFSLYDIRARQFISSQLVAISNPANFDFQPYQKQFAYQSSDSDFTLTGTDGSSVFNGKFKNQTNRDKAFSLVSLKFHPFMSTIASYMSDGSVSVSFPMEL